MPLFLGLDVGTQGARAIVCSEAGDPVASASETFGDDALVPDLPPGWSEQRPEAWWSACERVLRRVMRLARDRGHDRSEVAAVAVDSTSGTVLPIDAAGDALRPAIMYNDTRAEAEARQCNEAAGELTDKLGYKFGSSFGLPKILWILKHEPETRRRAKKVIHAADYVVGKLTGGFGGSDNSNALKSGYDLVDECWPRFISDSLGLEIDRLPEVVRPGEPMGRVGKSCSEATGLAEGTPVVGGISDGTAGFVASGACDIGEWNSTIGTTLVIRGVSPEIVRDLLGRIYCHRHPDGFWLPGGASNVGGECLEKVFPGEDFGALDEAASKLAPTGLIVYPLVRRGERLPFVDASAEGFVAGDAGSRAELYAGYLEGVAFVERWCFELMAELGAAVGETVYATGGGAKSLPWMRIRASVLGRRTVRPAITDAAMGAAVVAASRTVYSSLVEASKAMVRQDVAVEPEKSLSEDYEERYAAFRRECARRGLGPR